MIITTIALLFISLNFASASEQELRILDFGWDQASQVIELEACSEGSFNKPMSEIDLRIDLRDMELLSLIVEFHDGSSEFIPIYDQFRINKGTDWLKISKEKKCISKIIVEGMIEDCGCGGAQFEPEAQGAVIVFGR